MTLQFLGYALPGAVMFLFGVGWSWGHAAPPRPWPHRPYSYYGKQAGRCAGLRLDRHPVQGILKIFVSVVGMVGSMFAAYPDGSFQYVGDVQFATMYLFFALSGLLDVLAGYCPHAVRNSHARLGLSLAFFAEAFLFYHGEGQGSLEPAGRHALQLLVAVMVACGVSTALPALLPLPAMDAVHAVRCLAALVHGTWFYHCGVLLYWPRTAPSTAPAAPAAPPPATLWVSLAFSWHCAAAVSLLVVLLVTRRSLCGRDRDRDRGDRRLRTFATDHGPPSLSCGRGPPLTRPRAPAPAPASPHHSCMLCDAATSASYHRSSSLA